LFISAVSVFVLMLGTVALGAAVTATGYAQQDVALVNRRLTQQIQELREQSARLQSTGRLTPEARRAGMELAEPGRVLVVPMPAGVLPTAPPALAWDARLRQATRGFVRTVGSAAAPIGRAQAAEAH